MDDGNGHAGVGSGIATAADSGLTNDLDTITNNVVYNNAAANGKNSSSSVPGCGIVLAAQGGTVTNAFVSHNYIWNPQTGDGLGGTPCNSSSLPLVAIAGSNTATVSGTVTGVDPKFVSYVTGGIGTNAHLMSGSPLADGAGTNQCASGITGCLPLRDFDGNVINPASPPIGAFVLGGSPPAPTAPSPPTGLTVEVH